MDNMKQLNTRGLVLIGCGFIGQALLEGWLVAGLSPEAVTIQDPTPSDWLSSQSGIRLNTSLPEKPAVVVIATKPQTLDALLPDLAQFSGGDTVVVSIAAGAPIGLFEQHLGTQTPIIRAMPNLPASVGLGATAMFANTASTPSDVELAKSLFDAVGLSVQLPQEDLLHVVTGLSGSGPAYVFAMAEAMTAAAADLGLPMDLAKTLALQTVAGAGKMLAAPGADASTLRDAVTSKGGTTAAGLDQMIGSDALTDLMSNTINAAQCRSQELAAANTTKLR
ncbi:MAG: pyrroline-5-carboxylate reductase [Litoreibacter sp.]|uniref:pyrroline-5-carboxylate reductase n=1 Tax=Litoreibacter sp. TaxID=1969459 RepID=UPI00329A1173